MSAKHREALDRIAKDGVKKEKKKELRKVTRKVKRQLARDGVKGLDLSSDSDSSDLSSSSSSESSTERKKKKKKKKKDRKKRAERMEGEDTEKARLKGELAEQKNPTPARVLPEPQLRTPAHRLS